MGYNFTYAECKAAIETLGLGGPAFSRTLPVSFQILTQVCLDVDAEARKFASALIGTYQNLGSVIAMVDGDVSPQEKQDLDRYINMLERYAATF